jgi:hypothetical protein
MNIRFEYNMQVAEDRFSRLRTSSVIDEISRNLAQVALKALEQYSPGSERFRTGWKADETLGMDGHITEIYIHHPWERQDIVFFLEGGTRPHEIKAKAGGFLRFLDPDFPASKGTPTGDDYWYAKSVMHPGTIAYNMVGMAYYITGQQLDLMATIIEERLGMEIEG